MYAKTRSFSWLKNCVRYSMKNLLITGLLFSMGLSTSNMFSTGLINGHFIHILMQDTITLQGRWELMPVMASDTAAGKIPFLNFDLKTDKFSGNTGCNNITGGFLVKQDALQFSENIISTKMACEGYNEKAFLENLLKTNRYEIKNGVLQLMFNATVLSKWVRHNDPNPTKQI